jgi:superfamily II DNA or RNA helicase
VQTRPYQQEVIDGALEAWREHRRIAAVMATGAGKTIVFSHIAKLGRKAGKPTLVLAHRTELIEQATDKLKQINPDARVGVMQGRVKQYRAEIVVASIQTASGHASINLLKSRRWGLIIIDETHHAVADTYLRVLRELGAYEPDGPLVLGVTATLDRGDDRALGDVFETIVEPKIGILQLVKQGYLVPPRGVRVKIAELDLGRVRQTAGDFNSGALGSAMSAAMAPKRIVEAWQEHAPGRPTVAFLPTVALSIEQAQTFNDAGVIARHLDGGTPAAERAEALEAFRRGEITALCNVGLFTEGTDLPSIACVILGRPTSSGSLYTQMVGRGLRLHPGKRDCVVLDVTGVTGRHKLATLASLGGASGPEDMPDDLLLYEVDEDADELLEAAVELPDAPGEPEPVDYADGDLAHELVDLFGQSHSTWLRTPGGRWFIPAGSAGFVYLQPRGIDRYDLRFAAQQAVDPRRGEHVYNLLRSDMEIGYAMAAGDEYVASRPEWQAERAAPWRSLPSTNRRGARTRGEVADELSVALAARLIDG